MAGAVRIETHPGERNGLKYAYAAILVSSLVFVGLMWRAAHLIDRADNGINAHSYFLTHFLTLLLQVALWAILAKAAVRFKYYARTVINSKDGQALDYIANGLLLSLLYAILFGMASTIKSLFMNSSQLRMVTTITNLVPLVVILVATALLLIGARRLSKLSMSRPNSFSKGLFLLAYVALIIIYLVYFYHMAGRLLDDDGLRHFALSTHSLLVVYALPQALVWVLGGLACLNLAHYYANVAGKIYKPLFRNLYLGLVTSFVGTYLVQIFYVSNLSSNHIGPGLLFAVVVLGLLIYGCSMVYRGTNALYLIENN